MRYREIARKLRTLGCEELPRRGGGSHRMWHNSNLRRPFVISSAARNPLAERKMGNGWVNRANAVSALKQVTLTNARVP